MKKGSKKQKEEDFAVADVLVTQDTLNEIQGFFPLGNPKVSTAYGLLSLKINEVDTATKEIIYESSKKKLSRTINIHEQYSREEVIFYSYVLLHAKYDTHPFSSSKSSKSEDSNLKDFCHDFFSKAKDYTYKGNRDEFTTKRIFEMFLYCSIKNEEEYDLPPFEEYWRIFLVKDKLLPTTYELIFKNEKNSIRKEAVAEKAFFHTKEFMYLRYILEQLFSKKKYKEFIKVYLKDKDISEEQNNFPYQPLLYFNFVESCIASGDFKTLKENMHEGDILLFGGRFSSDFIKGIVAYFEKKYATAEKLFKKAILADEEARDVTRNITVFYLSSLLKQKKNDVAKSHIFDLQPREPHIENYDIDDFNYKKIEKEVLDELQKLNLSSEEKSSISFYEASLLHEKSWHILDKDISSILLKKLKGVKGYEDDYTYNYLLSEAYFKLGAYDKAYKTMLKSVAGQEERIYPSYSASIDKTTDDFQEKLPTYIKDEFLYAPPKRFEALIENELSNIIDHWWKSKRYFLISELCEVIEEHGSIDDFDEYLFEFAYSFKEMDQIEKAKKYYELSVNKKGENSSVLNNLAIIYEHLGDLKNAKKTIMRAFELSDGNDAIVNRNKKRLIDDKNKKNSPVPEKKIEEENLKDDYLEYDLDYGKIFYKGKDEPVRSSKMMPFILRELFTNPQKAKNAIDILRNAELDDMTPDRSLGDCVRQINAKIRKLGIKEDIFSYRSEKVLTQEHFLKRLRLKVSEVESK
jgi:hypothetical protein